MADQVNISWKADSNGKQIFQAALDKWGADKPKSAGAGDFVLDLIRRVDKAEAAIETSSRLKALGIKELVEMHQRRAQADARMLEQIADLIADAQGKAEEAVKAQLEALQKSKGILEASIQKVTGELEKSGQELEAVKLECKQIAAGKAESDRQCQSLLAELEDTKAKLDKVTLASEQAASQLEQEKLASIALKENAIKHEAEINAIQKKAIDAETAYRQKIAELEQELAKLQTEQARAQLEADSRIDKLQTKCDQLLEKLEQAKADREQAQKERQEKEKAVSELAEARIKVSALEATVKAHQESIKNMGMTMEVLRNFKAVLERRESISATVTPPVKTVNQPDQQGKTK